MNFLLLYIFITNGCAETDIPLKVTIKSSILLRSLYCLPRVISITERGFIFDFYRQSFIFDGQGFYVPYSPAFRQVPLQRTIPPPPPTAAVVPAAVTEKKKNRWSETEEKLLIEVYGENEQRLKYKAYFSPEWQEVAEELHNRCLKQQVSCEKTPKQCKDKLANLRKKYKTVKDKLGSTGFGKGGEPDEDADFNEQSDPKEFIPQNFHDMDEVLGGRESVDPQHVLESSDVALNQDEVEKSALDNEIIEASKKVRSEASSGTSNIPRSQSPNPYSDDDDIAFSRSLFFQSKSSGGVKRKKAALK